MQSNGSKRINFLHKSEAPSLWKWNNNQKRETKTILDKMKKEAATFLGPGVGAGIGCGAGFGAGLVGGFGHAGWPWNEIRLVFGFGVGCGVGVGFGYGQGKGYGCSMDSIGSYLNGFDSDLVQT